MKQNTAKDTDTRLLSIQEVCRQLGITHCSVYKQIHSKSLKTVKIGRRRLVRVSELDAFIKAMED